MKQFFVWTDGGARGNPGPAGFGVVIQDENGQTCAEIAEYLGETTNNVAEYWGVIAALEKVTEIVNIRPPCLAGRRATSLPRRQAGDLPASPAGGRPPVAVHVKMDSELVVRQLSGEYKIKNEGLKPLHWKIRDLILALGGRVHFEHVPRRENKRADALANEAMDRAQRSE